MKPRSGKIEDEYAWATECNLATLSGLCFVKKSSLVDINRQRNICFHMLKVCQEHESEITWHSGQRLDYPRVWELLKETEGNLYDALNAWTKKCFDTPEQAERWWKSYQRSEKDRRGF